MSKDVDTHDLFKGDTFRTAFLSEMVDFVCEKKPHNLVIRDLEYAKIVRCKNCQFRRGEKKGFYYGIEKYTDDDDFCSRGERTEDE